MPSKPSPYIGVKLHERLILASAGARLVFALLVHLIYHNGQPVVLTGRLLHEIARDADVRLSRATAIKGLNELTKLGMIETSKIGHALEVRLPHV